MTGGGQWARGGRYSCQVGVQKLGYRGASVARFLGMTTSSVNRVPGPDEMAEWDAGGGRGGVVSEWTYKYFRISGKSSEWATRTAADGVTPWNCATSTRPHPVSAVWAYPTFYAIPLHLSNQFRNNVLPRTPFRMPSGRVEVRSIDPAAYAKPHRSVPMKNQP